MSNTANLNLTLTPENDTTTTFKAWRLAMNGEGDSNMIKIDKAVGEIDKALEESVSEETFLDKLQTTNKMLTIIAAQKGRPTAYTYADIHEIVRSGLAPQCFAIGDQINVTRGEETLTFDVIGFDHDVAVDPNIRHTMTLQLHNLWGSYLAFDASEALLVAKQALPAGTYNITLDHGAYGGGTVQDTTYQFTTTVDIPIGGAIKHSTMGQYQSGGYTKDQITSGTFTTYATADAENALESNIATTEGAAGINLGTVSANNPSYRVENDYCYVNFTERNRYGSNNWSQSALRQWMNTAAAGGSWWTAQTRFDRPANANIDGFLKGMDTNFLKILCDVEKTTQQSIADGYGLATSSERFFLLSRPEVYFGTERSTDGADGTVYAYYGQGLSDLSTAGTGKDTNRIKYKGSTPYYWWLRSPHAGNGNGVRCVNPDGVLNSSTAYSSYGVAPACVIG